MVNLGGMFNKAKRFAAENSDSVRGGLDKVEHVVNDRTKGKYADKLAKGREGLTKALGVPGEARDAYRGEAAGPASTTPDADAAPTIPAAGPAPATPDADPVDRPSPFDAPGQSPRDDGPR